MYKACFIFTLLIATSCGYRVVGSEEEKSSLIIPFVENDQEGYFTNYLVEKVAACGLYRMAYYTADYKLLVNIDSIDQNAIGYRRERNASGQLKENLIKDENRWEVKLKVTMYKGEKIEWGPIEIVDFLDYDYSDQDTPTELVFTDTQGQTQGTLSYSLGQFESISSAQEAARRRLYERAAQKVVDVIKAKW